MRPLVAVAALWIAFGSAPAPAPALAETPVQTFEVVRDYPHDAEAFTEGLFFLDGTLYESTGLYPSFIRKVELETGK
ncbi:hypothetical protein LTR94_036405, partial [Friedmanniomyces endolithicus]